ncbi:MAG: MBL fold metallo-hydrolase [Anaerolineae bacterium]|nr:MBL fold metallo-hydrolase [Anaerolineae bacterium]
MKLQLIRNATLRLQYAGHVILIDPDLAPAFSRRSFTGRSPNPMVELPIPIDQILHDVEFVVVSHLHQDHFDTVAYEVVPKHLPLICQPGDETFIHEKGFQDVMPLESSYTWQGIQFKRIGGHHGTGEVETIMKNVMGMMIQARGEPTIYWAGDTILCDEVRQAISDYAPDVIVTHSCGAMWPDSAGERWLIVMDADQTIETCRIAPPHTMIIATHMEALDHATTTRGDLRKAAELAGILPQRLAVPSDGEILTIEISAH